jgi:RNA polymerase sigma-70 factor (ECF subfamily)
MSTLTDETEAATAGRERAPESPAETQDSAHRILSLMPKLTASQQEVIRLRFQSGLSYKEISGVTGMTVNHVGVVLHNALKTLREELQTAVA